MGDRDTVEMYMGRTDRKVTIMKDDTISRAAAIDAVNNMIRRKFGISADLGTNALSALPSAQPNLSEAYSKAVFTWLMDYQIRAAELKGRYTPYEVLSWVINDWRKENE